MPPSDLLEFPILSLGPYRHLVPLLDKFLEAAMIEKEVFLLVKNLESLSHFLSGVLKDVSPRIEDVPLGNGSIIRGPSNGVLDLFIPATRFEVSMANQCKYRASLLG